MPDEREQQRSRVVGQLPKRTLREDAALKRVAQTVRSICDTTMAHVSLMEDDYQCVVGHSGFELAEYDREDTFCTYAIAAEEVLIVEDTSEDPRFEDNPFVTEEPGISFYLGLPLIVENVPVGTLCAIETKPRSIDLKQRGELFGLVHAVESHLEIITTHEARTPKHGVSSKLTAVRALAAQERYFLEDRDSQTSLRELEAETAEAFDMLSEFPEDAHVELGMADTAVDEESP